MIDEIRSSIVNVLSNKKFLVILLVAIIFIAAAIYTYRNYVRPRMDAAYVPNKEFIQEDEGTSYGADLYYFYTEWCPHCKKASPVIMKLKEYIESKGGAINGVKVNVIEIDCEKDTATPDKFKVEGYPTIKLAYQGKVIEYDAKPDMDTLIQFLETSLH